MPTDWQGWRCGANMPVNRFPDEDPQGPVDTWLHDIIIPPIPATEPRVALICLWIGASFPPWMEYFVISAAHQASKGSNYEFALKYR